MENFQANQPKPTLWEANPNLKTLLLVLIGVFLFSGIGLTIFMVWSNNYRQQVYEQTQAGLPVHQVKEATTTSGSQIINPTDTADWKTYKNEQYGFEFKYPPDKYALDDLKNFQPDIIVSLYNIQQAAEVEKCHCGELSRFQVSIMPNPAKLSLDAFAKQNFPNGIYNMESIKIGENNAVKFGEMDQVVLIAKDDQVFYISPIDEITATFKFTK